MDLHNFPMDSIAIELALTCCGIRKQFDLEPLGTLVIVHGRQVFLFCSYVVWIQVGFEIFMCYWLNGGFMEMLLY